MFQLLAIFTPEELLQDSIDRITGIYSVCFKKIFVLSIEGKDELLCTFNIEKQITNEILPGAILLHRKKETNTLYTINSLNAIIKKENNNQLDMNYKIDWNPYRNSLILTVNSQIKMYPTQIYKIITISDGNS